MACAAGLEAIAITDHDTVDGVHAALGHGIPPTLRFLTGIEISAAPPAGFPFGSSFHLLGYGFRADDPDLNRTLTVLQDARRNRYPRIIDRLNRLGIHLNVTDLAHRFRTESQIGRPHIARLLVERGHAASIDDAFDRYLGKGRPAFADKYRISCEEAIRMIRTAGGITVLAHPGLLTLPEGVEIAEIVASLVDQGLQGIETEYPDHRPDQREQYRDLARRHGLVMTGGSDFHGNVKPGVRMGTGSGDLSVPFRFYEAILGVLAKSPGRTARPSRGDDMSPPSPPSPP